MSVHSCPANPCPICNPYRDYAVPYRTVIPANDAFEPEYEVYPWDDDSECVEDMLGLPSWREMVVMLPIAIFIGLLLATGGVL